MNKVGFTLIEMLVVISIIGILATLVTANLNSARSRARDTQRKSDIKNIATALRVYYNDKNRYPATLPSWGEQWSDSSTVYMPTLPRDPFSPTQDYRYIMGTISDSTDTDSFTLQACLENKSDANGIPAESWCPTGTMFQITP
jgi:general secretion pathway protein G